MYYNFKCFFFFRYVEELKFRKQEYPKLVSNKEEEQINLIEYVFSVKENN